MIDHIEILILTDTADKNGNRLDMFGIVLPPNASVVVVLETVPIFSPIAIVPVRVDKTGVYALFKVPVPEAVMQLTPMCEITGVKSRPNILMGVTLTQYYINCIKLHKGTGADKNILTIEEQIKQQFDVNAPNPQPVRGIQE